MRRSVWLFVGLASLAAIAACGPTVNVEQERAALLAADRAWSETTKEPEKFVAYFADGAAIYPPGMPIVTGGDAIRKTFTEMSKAPGFALSWAPAKAEVGASGDLGYTTGAYEMTMGGATEKGKYVDGMEERDRRRVEGDRGHLQRRLDAEATCRHSRDDRRQHHQVGPGASGTSGRLTSGGDVGRPQQARAVRASCTDARQLPDRAALASSDGEHHGPLRLGSVRDGREVR